MGKDQAPETISGAFVFSSSYSSRAGGLNRQIDVVDLIVDIKFGGLTGFNRRSFDCVLRTPLRMTLLLPLVVLCSAQDDFCRWWLL